MIKVYDKKLFFANKPPFAQEPVAALVNPHVEAIQDFRYDMNFHNASEYEVTYYNPRTGKLTKEKKSKSSTLIAESGTLKRIVTQLADPSTAQAIAASIDGQQQVLINWRMLGDPVWVAGSVFELEEMVRLNGKYVVVTAEHTFGNNWTVAVSAENLF